MSDLDLDVLERRLLTTEPILRLGDSLALIRRLREAEGRVALADQVIREMGRVDNLRLHEIVRLERVREVAQQISDNEIRYRNHPVPAAAIGWNDARNVLRTALAAVDEAPNTT